MVFSSTFNSYHIKAKLLEHYTTLHDCICHYFRQYLHDITMNTIWRKKQMNSSP